MQLQNCEKLLPGKKHINLVRILALLALVFIFGLTISIGTLANSPSSLKAAVEFDGKQFRVFNNDDFDWTDARLVVNADYKLTAPKIFAHSEFVAECSLFVKDDGTKLDPASTTPSDFYIVAGVPGNQKGSWFFKFQ